MNNEKDKAIISFLRRKRIRKRLFKIGLWRTLFEVVLFITLTTIIVSEVILVIIINFGEQLA